MMKSSSALVFDLEADNLLLMDISCIWCIVTKDIDTEEVRKYHGDSVSEGAKALDEAGLLIGHNIINYDIPVLQKLYKVDINAELFDTIVVSRVLDPDRSGGHSLNAWGKRLGRYKPAHEDWSRFSSDMLYRCVEDVEINFLLYKELLKEIKKD